MQAMLSAQLLSQLLQAPARTPQLVAFNQLPLGLSQSLSVQLRLQTKQQQRMCSWSTQAHLRQFVN